MILAIDPGRDKCGLALLDYQKRVHRQEIIPTKELALYLIPFFRKQAVDFLILGDGTYSDAIKNKLEEITELPVYLVEESRTTLLAEERYRQDHLYRGWRRILAFIKSKPKRPVDDYVAIILAERFLEDNNLEK